MRRIVAPLGLLAACLAAAALTGRAQGAQQTPGPAEPPRHPSPSGMSQPTLDDMLIRFPLPAGQEAYADIDGKRMHRYVVEQANIARRYRDQGHPKYWGRIIGTSADVEYVDWMLARFKSAGLTDARSQPLDLVPQWFHHNSGEGSAVGNEWITQNRQKLFAKTALAINVEHPATIQTQSRPRYYNANEIVWGNTYMPQQWYAGGPSRPELQKIVVDAFRQFGATLDLFPNPTPPASDMSAFFRFLPGVDTSEYHHYFHTDLETPQTVPWTGLEASTRAYAKIIDEVNKLPLSTFQRAEEPTPTRQ